MKVYIATRLERHADHNAVRDALAARGIGLTYDWTSHGPVYAEGCERIRQVACLEMGGVRRAAAVVVLLPGGRGTHAELGMALAMDKPVFLHSQMPSEHYGAVAQTCAFYHHPNCIWTEGPLERLAERVAGYLKEQP